MDRDFFNMVRSVKYSPGHESEPSVSTVVDLISASCPVPSDLFNDLTLQDLVNWLVRLAKDAHRQGFEDAVNTTCAHGVKFDLEQAKHMDTTQVRKVFPRLSGPCPEGCGYDGIFYASLEHFVYGDW